MAGAKIGILEWFRPGEYDHVERVLEDMRGLGIDELRTGVSWADWLTSDGETWYRWLLPRLSREVNILPCFVYTPPTVGVAPKTSSPPTDLRAYADFIDQMITLFGEHFEWLEFWNEPNNLREWDATMDPEWLLFSEMVGAAAYWAKKCGKKTVLGGPGPADHNWIRLMCERGVVEHIDAVGIHGFPSTFEFHWEGWKPAIERVQAVLDLHRSDAEIWVTETGYSTFRHDERRQLETFVEALEAPAKRVYWYSMYDLHPDLPTVDGFHSDEREYHFGLKTADARPKLLYRLWQQGGVVGVRDAQWLASPAELPSRSERPALITGGAGFIGTNLARRLLSRGRPVVLFDDLSRPGVERNLRGVRDDFGDAAHIELADIRDVAAMRRVTECAAEVYHLAAQVAVTTSVEAPVRDFEVNLQGTLNLLECLRRLDNPPPLLFTSTNKVYGALDDIDLCCSDGRWLPVDPTVRAHGISEERSLNFHSPYGCSKGAADQYVLDYSRIYGIPATVFRMSCIYGPHQRGNEDQGWVAHFLLRALAEEPITLFGDGRQVRDILFVDDLIDAFLLAMENMDTLKGQAFNMGGGPVNAVSLADVLSEIENLHGLRPQVRFEEARPGDQRYFVSDTRRFRDATGWKPTTGSDLGLRRLYGCLCDDLKRHAKPFV